MTNTHDHDIANQIGAQFRTDLNNVLDDIQSSNSGASEPTTKVAYKLWIDTSNNRVKIRNGANNAWIDLGSTTTDMGHATAASPSLTGTVTSAGDIVCNSNARIKLPVGTTGQRPGSPATGDVRYNSTLSKQETYNGSAWVTSSIPSGGSANNVLKNNGSGGLAWDTVANLITVVNGAQVSTFSSSGTFTPASGRTGFLFILIGGGGSSGGGRSNNDDNPDRPAYSGQAGSGATALKFYNASELGANASVTVGSGGSASTGNGNSGGSSSVNPAGSGATCTAGGGGGSDYASAPGSGFTATAGGSAGLCSNHLLGWHGTVGLNGNVSGYAGPNPPEFTAYDYGKGGAGKHHPDASGSTGNAGGAGFVVVFQW